MLFVQVLVLQLIPIIMCDWNVSPQFASLGLN